MSSFLRISKWATIISVLLVGSLVSVAYANHSWGKYHWARQHNPFNLKLGDNVSAAWDGYLATTSSDWSRSTVLDTVITAGQTKSNCRPTNGRVEVCNKAYGNNGWLGVAQVWVNDSHITQGTVKINDTYFNTATYNTPAWRNLVMCQEVGHTLGLDHQDEKFNNTNLGTCMDYTTDPDGPPSNEHPTAHVYEELGIIYAHLDSFTTVGAALPRGRGQVDANDEVNGPQGWGKEVRRDSKGHTSLFELDLGKGNKVFTFVTWAD